MLFPCADDVESVLLPLKARRDPLESIVPQAMNVIVAVGGHLVPAARSPADSGMFISGSCGLRLSLFFSCCIRSV